MAHRWTQGFTFNTQKELAGPGITFLRWEIGTCIHKDRMTGNPLYKRNSPVILQIYAIKTQWCSILYTTDDLYYRLTSTLFTLVTTRWIRSFSFLGAIGWMPLSETCIISFAPPFPPPFALSVSPVFESYWVVDWSFSSSIIAVS